MRPAIVVHVLETVGEVGKLELAILVRLDHEQFPTQPLIE